MIADVIGKDVNLSVFEVVSTAHRLEFMNSRRHHLEISRDFTNAHDFWKLMLHKSWEM